MIKKQKKPKEKRYRKIEIKGRFYDKNINETKMNIELKKKSIYKNGKLTMIKRKG